jgi:hypothetical protein
MKLPELIKEKLSGGYSTQWKMEQCLIAIAEQVQANTDAIKYLQYFMEYTTSSGGWPLGHILGMDIPPKKAV